MNEKMRETYIVRSCILLILLAIVSGCVNGPNDEITLPPADEYDTAVAVGWLGFNAGSYDDAALTFGKAVEIDPTLSQAYLGLGWSYAMLDQTALALPNLDLAIARDSESPDGYAAKAFVHLARGEYEAAIEAARQAIDFGGEDYVFSQIPDVQTRNLRLVMVESHHALGQYSDAQAQVDTLNPDNNLDEDSRTYKQDLLLEIEDLGSVGLVLEELIN